MENQPSQTKAFFLATLLVIYDREGAQKQRSLNVIVETDNVNLTKHALGEIQKIALRRIHAENNVLPDAVKDVVVQYICFMGYMTPEAFYGEEETQAGPLDGPAAGAA